MRHESEVCGFPLRMVAIYGPLHASFRLKAEAMPSVDAMQSSLDALRPTVGRIIAAPPAGDGAAPKPGKWGTGERRPRLRSAGV